MCLYMHSVVAGQNEQKEAKDWLTDKHTNQVRSHVTFLTFFINVMLQVD